MKIKQVSKEGNKVTFEVVADKHDVARALQVAAEAFASSMGLQPEANKTVHQVAEEKMGIRDLDSMIAPNAVEALVPLVLDKKNLIPAYPPHAIPQGNLKRDQEFRFALEVALRPEYELSSYEPVTVKVRRLVIPEEAVNAEIASITNEYTAYVPDPDAAPDAPIKAGDFIKIAIKATSDGEDFKKLNTDGRIYAVGAGHMPSGFDSQIQEMKVGETKSFAFEAPSFDDDFNEIAKTINATVTVLERLKEQQPTLTDEWVARNMPMFKSAEEMKKSIRKNIEMRERGGYDAYVREAVASQWAQRFEGKIDDEVYESMMRQLRENIQMGLRSQEKTWDDFVKENGGESQVSMALMLEAREVLTQGYALDSIYRHFKLAVTENDILEVCRSMNPSIDPRELHEQIKQHGQGFALRESAERFKANQYAVDNAIIEYVD